MECDKNNSFVFYSENIEQHPILSNFNGLTIPHFAPACKLAR